MLRLTVYSVPKTRLGDIYLLQTSVVNLHYTIRDRGLGGLVPPANFEASFCFSSACLATRYIWSPQFLSLLRVLWCELAFFLLGLLPARTMEKHLAEWRKMKPKIVATCHPLSIFEKCTHLSNLFSSPLYSTFLPFLFLYSHFRDGSRG